MRKSACLLLMMLLPEVLPGQSVEPATKTQRLSIASGWLDDLCAVPPNAFLNMTADELSAALNDWLSGKTNTDSCHAKLRPIEPDHEINLDRVNLIPSLSDRILRMAEFQADGQQTPDYVYGVHQNAPAGTPSAFIANTDHGIFSYGGPLHFDELFVSSDQRVALCMALGADKQKAGAPVEEKDKTSKQKAIDRAHCNDEVYMATSRYRDSFARIGSAVTLNIRFSQIPLFQSGVLISPQSPDLQKWSATVTGGFDTSKLYRSLSEVQSLAKYISSNERMQLSESQRKNFVVATICGDKYKDLRDAKNANRCVGNFAMGSKVQRTLLFVLPTIAVKVTSPFDLAKYGSTFEVPPNHSGRSLYDVSLTWNLHNQIPNAATRAAAIQAADSVFSAKQSAKPADADWRMQVKMLYMELKRTPEESISETLWNQLRTTMLNQKKQ